MNRPRPCISLIAAMARNRVIGRDGRLPWSLPEDLKFFKRTTMGHPIVMGRRTFETDAGVLPGRTNIVLTRQPEYVAPAGVVICRSFDEMLQMYDGADEELFIIGGGVVYAEALPVAHRLYLTRIDREYMGDAFFPPFDEASFVEKSRESFDVPMPYTRLLLERAE